MSTNPPSDLLEILLVEDDADDVEFAEEGLQESRVPHHLNVVADGVEALAYLRKEGKHAQAARPHLVLLDLQLPKKGGMEVLAEMKADPDLRKIPVIVLTTSNNPEDMLKAYDLKASLYVTKSGGLEELHKVMSSMKDFCLTVVKLPTGE
jgi:CheY-like chemotaxis protein